MVIRGLHEYFELLVGQPLPLPVPREASPVDAVERDGVTMARLVASPSAADNLLLVEGSAQTLREAAEGYFLAGFWGHGVNSYSFYWCQVDRRWRVYLRLPFGGAYSDAQAQGRRLMATMTRLRELLERAERGAARRVLLFDSIDWVECEIELFDGRVISCKGDLASWHDLAAEIAPAPPGSQGGRDSAAGEHRNPALEEAVLEQADIPDPYLVYGDWLQGCGDPRGELIAFQHEMAQSDDKELEARRDELLAAVRPGLLGELATSNDVTVTWHLGFLSSARLRLGEDMKLLHQLLSLPAARSLRELIVEPHDRPSRSSGVDMLRARDVMEAVAAASLPLLCTLVINGRDIDDTTAVPAHGRRPLPEPYHCAKAFERPIRHRGYVDEAMFSPDGELLFTLGDDCQSLRVWRAENGQLLREIDLGRSTTENALLGMTAKGRAVVTGEVGTRIIGLSGGEWQYIATLQPVRLSADGAILLGAIEDQDVRWSPSKMRFSVVRMDRGRELARFGHGDYRRKVRGELSPSGRLFAEIAPRFLRRDDNDRSLMIMVWETFFPDSPRILRGHDKAVLDLAFSRDSARLVSCDAGRVWLWQLEGGGGLPLPLVPWPVGELRQVRLVSGDREILVIGETGDLALYDLDTEQWIRRVATSREDIKHVAVSPDGRTLALIRFLGQEVELWQLDAGKRVR